MMIDEKIKDRRVAPRSDVPIQAVVVGDRKRRVLITRDIGPYGAFFLGDYSVKKGARLHVRLDIAVEENNIPSVMSLDAYVLVIRVDTSNTGEPTGFAAQWIRASSVGEVLPLKELLKTYLHVAGGFVHVLKPESEGEVPIYSFSFPKPEEAHAASSDMDSHIDVEPGLNTTPKEHIPAVPSEVPMAQDVSTPPKESEPVKNPEKNEQINSPQKKKSRNSDIPTRVYATLPIHYIYSGRTFDGTAVKLKKDGMRIDTQDEIPNVYSPIEVECTVYTPGKEGVLRLNGTVSLVKKAKHGRGGQFEIKFSLKNSPVILDGYRGMLKMLQESISQA